MASKSVSFELTRLLPPPSAPNAMFDVRWANMVDRYGDLPADYHDFLELYGAGAIDDELAVAFPAQDGRSELIEIILEHARLASAEFPEEHPFPPHPGVGGLFPWGTDGNGTYFYWQVNGAPDRWTVVVIGFEGGPIVRTQLSFQRFLVDLLSGHLVQLAFVPLEVGDHEFHSDRRTER